MTPADLVARLPELPLHTGPGGLLGWDCVYLLGPGGRWGVVQVPDSGLWYPFAPENPATVQTRPVDPVAALRAWAAALEASP